MDTCTALLPSFLHALAPTPSLSTDGRKLSTFRVERRPNFRVQPAILIASTAVHLEEAIQPSRKLAILAAALWRAAACDDTEFRLLLSAGWDRVSVSRCGPGGRHGRAEGRQHDPDGSSRLAIAVRQRSCFALRAILERRIHNVQALEIALTTSEARAAETHAKTSDA